MKQLDDTYLTGQLLIAMPGMEDPRFAKSVVYMCAHGPEGAMGLVINRALSNMTFPELLDQLHIPQGLESEQIRVHNGGPVEAGRGFVLHSSDYIQDSTMVIDDVFSLTATVDILRKMAQGTGPQKSLLALGYAGWSPGQLDAEMIGNGWLNVDADADIVFGDNLDGKWEQAIHKLGIDLSMLTSVAGHG